MSGQPSAGGQDDFSSRLQDELSRTQRGSPQATPEPTPETTEETQAESTGPVGTGEHVVRQGECISSIAKDTGHFWETIWNDGGNTELREARQDPNVLLPEDRVTVPEKRRKDEPIAAEQRHRFVRRGEPAKLHLRFCVDGKPRGNESYRIMIDADREYEGMLDADGNLECPVPGNARVAKVIIGRGRREREYEFQLGGTAPISELAGVLQRLNNLGFPCQPAEELTGAVRRVIRAFQVSRGLEPTGQPDAATRDALLAVHGS